MNSIIKEFNFPNSWFTGEKITLGEQVLLEVDIRHFAPDGWSTYKFMDPDKAAEFASQWASKGGAVVVGRDSVENELAGSRDFYYIFAGPLQSFYGTSEDEVPSKTGEVEDTRTEKNFKYKKITKESCVNLGLIPKPNYKDRIQKKNDKRLTSQGTRVDFYETNKPYGGMTKDKWEAEVARLMKQKYGLDFNDFDTRNINDMTPEDFVRWYGQKYNLDELDPI